MIGFSGGTYYQFMNVINIKRNVLNNAPGDLFAATSGGYNKTSAISKRIRELGIFNRVYDICVGRDQRTKGKANEALFGLSNRELAEEINRSVVGGGFDITKEDYEEFYAASGLAFNVRIASYFGSKNKEFKCYFYDEGIGQYYSKYRLYSGRDLLFSRDYVVGMLQKYKSLTPPPTGRFLYEPDLVCFANFNKLKKLPKINLQDKELIEIYNYIFDYKPDEMLEKSKVLFFNSGFFGEKEECIKKELQLLEVIEKHAGKKNLVIKFHPSVTEVPKEYEGYQTMALNTIPFESFIMNGATKGKILISPYSSALITPKLVFGLEQEFFTADSVFSTSKASIFSKTRIIYNDREKAHVLGSKEELDEALSRIKF